MARARHWGQLALGLLLWPMACTRPSTLPKGREGSSRPYAGEIDGEAPRPADCPAMRKAPEPLPGVRPEQRTAEYWIRRLRATGIDPEEVLLDPLDIEAHTAGLRVDPVLGSWPPLDQAPKPELVQRAIDERTGYLRERLADGRLVGRDGRPAPRDALEAMHTRPAPRTPPLLRIALHTLPLHCGPWKGAFFRPPVDEAFDRNRCSTPRAQEPLQVLGTWPGGLWLARTRYTMGWIAAEAPLSPPVPEALVHAVATGPYVRLRRAASLRAGEARWEAPAGSVLPLAPETRDRVIFGTAEGVFVSEPLEADLLQPLPRPLTRSALLREAFTRLGTRYGWGGAGGGLDCSRLMLETFWRFGLPLPRNSAQQAHAGTFTVKLEGASEAEKLALLDAALRHGVVLGRMPGHILLYLGRDERHRPMALHAFSEYLVPCEARNREGVPLETAMRVDRVTVSDLSLGAGSHKGSFLERLTELAVFGRGPDPSLQAVSTLRTADLPQAPPARCEDSLDHALFLSPRVPHPGQPLRILAVSGSHPGPVRLVLFDPEGHRLAPEAHLLGGPPYGHWVQWLHPSPGKWTAVLADGPRTLACERFTVRRHAPPPEPRPTTAAPAWKPKWRWERDTEHLYAAFVEQLFREPADDLGRTWHGLQTLLSDPARNLLHDHLGLGEDDPRGPLRLEPDCADLPYFLRAYFAWKLHLPFAFHRCSRGRRGRPPTCPADPVTNLTPVEAPDAVSAFARFTRLVARGVHSATARTLPDAERADLYPVPLQRRTLLPGTVFADPYGHLLVVARWIPQPLGAPGVLLAADAQPDGTIGRRRFWRGSFLFDPDTQRFGAGFKRWRPLRFDRAHDVVQPLPLSALREVSEDFAPFSMQQYEGSQDDFYEAVEAAASPRPLEPVPRMLALVDALEEQVRRRVVSVDNGVRFMREHGWRPVPMPKGYAIFETSGPWEDYSTPSRDLRLLIAIDAVLRFPERVARDPARFGLRAERVREVTARLHETLEQELRTRRFTYTRSDGSPWTLTLRDVVRRAEALEVAYHPNDCPEVRWGAPEGSEERRRCTHRAPQADRLRMERYRKWFGERKRPPREWRGEVP